MYLNQVPHSKFVSSLSLSKIKYVDANNKNAPVEPILSQKKIECILGIVNDGLYQNIYEHFYSLFLERGDISPR